MRRAIGPLESGEDGLQTAWAHLVAAQMLTLGGRYRQAASCASSSDGRTRDAGPYLRLPGLER